jgi:phosphatidylserine/phosphatidylglycerophosphate/cardiolipin synthase-like enzyme
MEFAVPYIHTKYMLVDPFGPDLIIITGSANFSDASTSDNDENMLIIRGDTSVADIYVTEHFRLWNHYAFRERAAKNVGKPTSDHSSYNPTTHGVKSITAIPDSSDRTG